MSRTTRELVPAAPQALAVRSAALVRRGLRDLARESNWLIRKVFEGPVACAAVSPDGQVSTLSERVRHGARCVTLFDIERGIPTLTLGPRHHTDAAAAEPLAKFSWSPDARYLLVTRLAGKHGLQIFDLRSKELLGTFGESSLMPSDVTWSPSGDLVACTRGGNAPSLEIWKAPSHAAEPGDLPSSALQRLGIPTWIERQSDEVESNEAGIFSGYGRCAFSPDERSLASVVEIGGDWADDSILLLETPSLRKKEVFEAQGHVTDLAWSNDGHRLVYCSAGQAYGIDAVSAEATSLPFGGERCAWHPNLPVCLIFSSWLRNSAKGRLFLADMNRMTVFDEYPAEGVLDIRWSADGSKAYAVTSEGIAYIYEPELL